MCTEFKERLAGKSTRRSKSSFVTKDVALCVVLAVALLAGGCGLRTLKKDLQQVAEQAVLEGQARVRGAESNPIVIVVYNVTANQIADEVSGRHERANPDDSLD